jgi:hypothetical protein
MWCWVTRMTYRSSGERTSTVWPRLLTHHLHSNLSLAIKINNISILDTVRRILTKGVLYH